MAEQPRWNYLDERCREMAAARGGLCLAERVDSPLTRVTWRCAVGHTWDASPERTERRWCRECAEAAGRPEAREREEVCRRIVRSHRAEVYGFTDPKMAPESRFRIHCRNRHFFDVRLDWLLMGTWCPACARDEAEQWQRSLELRKAQKHALRNRGALLAKAFVDPMLEMEWRCAAGHTFSASWFRVQRRPSFCPACEAIRQTARGENLQLPRDPRARPSKYTLAQMQALATERGGRCLSTTFHRLADALEWECAKGHRWRAPGESVFRHGAWCRRCAYDDIGARSRGYTIEECQALVAATGGRCLSERYEKIKANLEWECSKGHDFQMSVADIKNGRWCPVCAKEAAAVVREKKSRVRKRARWAKMRQLKRSTWSLEEMQERARALGGRCLATEYHGAERPIEWECAEGHRWFAKPIQVGLGGWCRICRLKEAGLRRRRDAFADCQAMARARGGKCLSEAYVGAHMKMEWECAEGHRWSTSRDSVRRGSWCRVCAFKVAAKKRKKRFARNKREAAKRLAVG